MSTVLHRQGRFTSEAATGALDQLRELGVRFAARAAEHDDRDRFVGDNLAELREHRYFSAAVPREFGGWGLSTGELAGMLRELARHCGSTALAFSMHTHQAAIAVWRFRHAGAPAEAMLRRLAQEQLALLSTGGGDWLDSNGTAVPCPGGYRVNAVKPFVSGARFGDVINTSAVLTDDQGARHVLHFGIPMTTAGISIESNWRTLGMRATGSEAVRFTDVVVPEQAVAVRRPAGQWHPALHVVAMIALPLVYSVYVGIAEAARDLVVQRVAKTAVRDGQFERVGQLDTELRLAQLAADEMVSAMETGTPGFDVTNRVMKARVLLARAVRQVLDLALDIGGGAVFYRAATVERQFRDVQASRYHPLQEPAQRDLAGRLALGLQP